MLSSLFELIISDKDIPFLESLENIPGVFSSLFIGFLTVRLSIEHADIKIIIYINKIYLIIY